MHSRAEQISNNDIPVPISLSLNDCQTNPNKSIQKQVDLTKM